MPRAAPSLDELTERMRALQQRATSEHRTLSQEITRILEEAVKGPRLPPNFVERRAPGQRPRRRDSDPLPRRRRDDLPYNGPAKPDEFHCCRIANR